MERIHASKESNRIEASNNLVELILFNLICGFLSYNGIFANMFQFLRMEMLPHHMIHSAINVERPIVGRSNSQSIHFSCDSRSRSYAHTNTYTQAQHELPIRINGLK